MEDSSYIKDVPKLLKEVSRDGAKWLIVYSKTILDTFAVWPEKQNNISRMVHLWFILSYIITGFGQLHYVTSKEAELATIAYTLSIFMIGIETTVRRILCYVYREKFSKILGKIYYDFWPSRSFGENVHKELTSDSMYVFIFCAFYTVNAFLCCMQYIIYPLTKGNLPLQSTYPFEWRQSPLYEILYVWQSLIALELSGNICGLDLFLVSLLSNCVAQFKLMRACMATRFKEIYKTNDKAWKLKDKVSQEFVIMFIKRHNELIRVCKEIDEAFTYFILVQYLTSMATVCLATFIAVAMPSELSTAITYLIGHMFELLIYCYMGNELIIESTNLQDTVFECGWHLYDTSQDLQKSLVMVMVRCVKPVKMSAGGFGFLSLNSFMKILQFSFSVFTLLNSMMKKGKGNH